MLTKLDPSSCEGRVLARFSKKNKRIGYNIFIVLCLLGECAIVMEQIDCATCNATVIKVQIREDYASNNGDITSIGPVSCLYNTSFDCSSSLSDIKINATIGAELTFVNLEPQNSFLITVSSVNFSLTGVDSTQRNITVCTGVLPAIYLMIYSWIYFKVNKVRDK